jgi:DTW domain-containing protein YfiP
MSTLSTVDDTLRPGGRCYGCFRPWEDCFCDAIPTIDNRTDVLILQHKRERFHRFGTARIVHRALRRSELRVGLDGCFADDLGLRSGAGLLYPGPDAELLDDLPVARRPKQLVILDGTWHHAKTMFRDLPALQRLPRYRLAPTAPSRYGFRREPQARFISTVEATIAALRILEPGLGGLDQLMDAFLTMVNRQLGRAKSPDGARTCKRPRRTFQNVPRALVGSLDDVVAAYGESTSRDPARPHDPRAPVYWVAERPATGERFSYLIEPTTAPTDELLGHWELTRDDFRRASSLAEARAAWQSFLRPTDSLTVYNQGVAELAAQLGTPPASCLVLKSVNLTDQPYTTLDELLAVEGIVAAAPHGRGRAERRLANLAALVRRLNALGNRVVDLNQRLPIDPCG